MQARTTYPAFIRSSPTWRWLELVPFTIPPAVISAITTTNKSREARHNRLQAESDAVNSLVLIVKFVVSQLFFVNGGMGRVQAGTYICHSMKVIVINNGPIPTADNTEIPTITPILESE